MKGLIVGFVILLAGLIALMVIDNGSLEKDTLLRNEAIKASVKRFMSGEPVAATDFPWNIDGSLSLGMLHHYKNAGVISDEEEYAFTNRRTFWKLNGQ